MQDIHSTNSNSWKQITSQGAKRNTILLLKFNQQCKNKEEEIKMHQNCPDFDGVISSCQETGKTVNISKFYIVMAEFK